MKKIILLTTAVIFFAAVFFSFQQTNQQLTLRHAEFLTKYSVYPVDVSKTILFCFENVLLNDFDVRERLENELLHKGIEGVTNQLEKQKVKTYWDFF